MLRRIQRGVLIVVSCATLMAGVLAMSRRENAVAQDDKAPRADTTGTQLPRPDPAFQGKIGETYRDSTPSYPLPVKAQAGSPNVLLVLLDDVGFGMCSTFRGSLRSLADGIGLRLFLRLQSGRNSSVLPHDLPQHDLGASTEIARARLSLHGRHDRRGHRLDPQYPRGRSAQALVHVLQHLGRARSPSRSQAVARQVRRQVRPRLGQTTRTDPCEATGVGSYSAGDETHSATRAIYHDGWVACSRYGFPWQTAGRGPDFLSAPWELYHVDRDFSQAENLAGKNPDKLNELQARFVEEARTYGVFPLDSRFTERMDPTLRIAGEPRSSWTYYGNNVWLPEPIGPQLFPRPHTITADIEIPEGGAEGVVACAGAFSAGWSLYTRRTARGRAAEN